MQLKKLVTKLKKSLTKKKIIISIFILLIACILLIHYEFPILKYCITKEKVYENIAPVNLHGKTVFISDMHLEEKHLEGGGSFPVNLPDNTENLVIVGDLFDSPEFFNKLAGEENNISKPFCTSLKFINNPPRDIYFIIGTPGHDPEFLAGPEFSNYEVTCSNSTIHIAGRLAIFEIDGLNVAAHHGDYIADGFVNCVISYFSKKLGKPLILERSWKGAISLNEDYWLITGHSHIPAVDYEHRVANPGAWVPVPIIGGDLKNILIVKNRNVTLMKLN